MFGYVQTDRPNLYIKDEMLYKSLYCGMCKSIGKEYGLLARITTSFDMTFMSALVHNYLDKDIDIRKCRCVLHPIKRRFIAQPDEVMSILSAVNVMLAYYKATDDILDEKSLKKRLARSALKKSYKRINKAHPQLESIIKVQYDRLRELEKQLCESIDSVSDCFGEMMKGLSVYILKEKTCAEFEGLCYSLGKWIYLIDAVDDLEKDYKSKSYNPFLVNKSFNTKEQFISANKNELEFALNTTINDIINDYSKLSFHFNTDLLKNIVLLGIKNKTKQILECNCKCKKTHSKS